MTRARKAKVRQRSSPIHRSFTAFAFSKPDRQRLSEIISAIPQLAGNHDQVIHFLKGVCWEAISEREVETESPTKSDIEKQIGRTRKKSADLLRELRRLELIVYRKVDTAEVFKKRHELYPSIIALYKAVDQFQVRTRWARSALKGATHGRKKEMAGRHLATSVWFLLHQYGVRAPNSSKDGPWASLLEVLCPIAGISAGDVTNHMRAIKPDIDSQP